MIEGGVGGSRLLQLARRLLVCLCVRITRDGIYDTCVLHFRSEASHVPRHVPVECLRKPRVVWSASRLGIRTASKNPGDRLQVRLARLTHRHTHKSLASCN
jgi:hypothetical protein